MPVLRDDLARTRARLDAAVAERDELLMRLDPLLGVVCRRRGVTEEGARRLMDDVRRLSGAEAE